MSDKLDPSALSVKSAVKVLKAVGAKTVTEKALLEDLEAGAPSNPDGTINLVHYAAWLVKELAKRGS